MEKQVVIHDALWRLVLNGSIRLLNDESIDVTARTLGDSDKRKAEEYARTAARATYAAALDPASELHAERMKPLDDASIDELVEIIVESKRVALRKAAVAELYPAESDAPVHTMSDSIEEEIKQEQLDDLTEKARDEWIADRMAELRLEYAVVNRGELLDMASKSVAGTLATVAFSHAYQDATLFYGILLADGKPFFAEMPKDAPRYIKEQALDLYLEVDPYLFRLP